VSAFVVLSLTLALAALAVMVVVVLELVRNLRRLRDSVSATTERLVPLTEELQSELAVTAVEVEGLTRQLEQASKQRQTLAKRARRSRSKRKR
jgi:predicted PurR-regulated permease PerM